MPWVPGFLAEINGCDLCLCVDTDRGDIEICRIDNNEAYEDNLYRSKESWMRTLAAEEREMAREYRLCYGVPMSILLF